MVTGVEQAAGPASKAKHLKVATAGCSEDERTDDSLVATGVDVSLQTEYCLPEAKGTRVVSSARFKTVLFVAVETPGWRAGTHGVAEELTGVVTVHSKVVRDEGSTGVLE